MPRFGLTPIYEARFFVEPIDFALFFGYKKRALSNGMVGYFSTILRIISFSSLVTFSIVDGYWYSMAVSSELCANA